MASPTLLLEALTDPARMLDASVPEWESVIAVSRRHGLAGRWYRAIETRAGLERLPPAVREQLAADARLAERRALALRWETQCAARALATVDVPLVILKGAAYIALDLPGAATRMSADLDILVPRAALERVEAACRAHGWRSQVSDTYDDAYFRRWMHELPPMQHTQRGTVIDIHHNILPLTARLCPDPALLLSAAEPLPDGSACTLAPADLLLHCLVHAFHDGEFLNALRDCLDVADIAAHFAADDKTFWSRLEARARELNFARPAAYGLAAAQRYFGLEVPAATLQGLLAAAGTAPFKPVFQWSLDQVIHPAARPPLRRRLAARLLQVRSHLHKMPLPMLTRHLLHKLRRRYTATQRADGNGAD